MKSKHIFLGIVVLAAVVRFFKIGIIPYGFNWDETSIVYNSWGIALWHRDEWANLMPLAFRSFGDYKAPLLFYMLAVPYMIAGIIPVLIRIYSAIAGVVVVIGTYYLAKELRKDKLTPIIASALVAISPWAINFSRVGFEANIGLAIVTWATVFLFWGMKKSWWLIPAAIFFSVSLYAYHSTKIFVPIFLLTIAIRYFHQLFTNKKHAAIAIVLAVMMVAPLLYITIFGKGFERGLTMIFFDGSHKLQTISVISTEFFKNLKNQYALSFLIGGKDAVGLRHLTPGFGIMYAIELPFFIFGIYKSLFSKQRESRLFVAWMIIGSLPAILSHQTPHAVRSLLMMPAMQMVTALGVVGYLGAIKIKPPVIKKILQYAPLAIVLVSFSAYLKTYYSTYAVASSHDFQYGYKEALSVAGQMGKTKDKIIVTDTYGQPYIYVLLHNRIKPEEFLAGALANYEFHTFSWPYYKPNSIIVGTPKEIPPDDAAVKKLIKIPGTQEVVFVIAETPKE